MSGPYLLKVLDEITDRTNGVVAANFLTSDVDPELVRLAAARVGVVDFFWSDPDPALIDIAHRQGALVSWQVGSLSEARAAVDALINKRGAGNCFTHVIVTCSIRCGTLKPLHQEPASQIRCWRL